MKLRVLAIVGAVMFLSTSTAFAQHGEGFVVGAAGGWSHSFASGALGGGAGGGEVVFGDRFGIGGEAGVLGGEDSLLLNLSADARVRLTQPKAAGDLTPFVSGGYSRLLFFEGSDNAFNVGAGADYRLSDSRSLRFEFRDMIRDRPGFTAHYWTVRVGMVFR